MFIDLESEDWPPLAAPYLASLHSSAITCSLLASDVASDVYSKIKVCLGIPMCVVVLLILTGTLYCRSLIASRIVNHYFLFCSFARFKSFSEPDISSVHQHYHAFLSINVDFSLNQSVTKVLLISRMPVTSSTPGCLPWPGPSMEAR